MYSGAYFSGDEREIEKFPAKEYAWEISAYSGEPAKELVIKGTDDVTELSDGSAYWLSV